MQIYKYYVVQVVQAYSVTQNYVYTRKIEIWNFELPKFLSRL